MHVQQLPMVRNPARHLLMFGFLNKLFPQRKLRAGAAYDLIRRSRGTDTFCGAVRQNSSVLDDRETRQRLADLARYEFRNNPHLRGLCQKIDNETVGRGPRLTIDPRTPSDRSRRAADRVEKTWQEWCCATKLVEKLRLVCSERRTGGEAFAVAFPNRSLQVPMDFKVYEGDQFQTPYWERDWYSDRDGRNDQGHYDGLNFDSYGNVSSYTMLEKHPYADSYSYDASYRNVDASLVWHWFRKERPSQFRGISEIAPTLEVYSNLRRFIESKVQQEELRAKLLGAVSTAYPPDAGCADLGDEPVDMMIGGGQFTTLPDGWKIDMFRFDPTGQGVQEFVRTMLSWATQALLAPWNIVAGDSSDYNFASGRLDHMTFYSYVGIMRSEIEKYGLNWFFHNHWFPIARLTNRIPDDLGPFSVTWYWDQREAIDPNKAANAATTLKEAGMLDEVGYWESQGENALDVAKRQARFEFEKARIRQELQDQYGFTPVSESPDVEQQS